MAQIQTYGALAPAVSSMGSNSTDEHTPSSLSLAARRLFTRGPVVRRTLQHLRPFVCPFEEVIRHVPRGSTVLDVGCGGGLFLGLLNETDRLNSRADAGGIGFDCSRPAIHTAQQMKLNSSGQAGLRFDCLDVAESWPTGEFDVVSIIDVMHHVDLEHRESLFRQAVEHIRPGGRLVYKDICSRSWRSRANQLHDLVVAHQLVRYTPIETIERWGRELGLRIEHSSRINRLWYGHELIVFVKPEQTGRETVS